MSLESAVITAKTTAELEKLLTPFQGKESIVFAEVDFDMAEAVLGLNYKDSQRDVSLAHVRNLVAKILNREIIPGTELTLVYCQETKKWHLVDGQHRLKAIREIAAKRETLRAEKLHQGAHFDASKERTLRILETFSTLGFRLSLLAMNTMAEVRAYYKTLDKGKKRNSWDDITASLGRDGVQNWSQQKFNNLCSSIKYIAHHFQEDSNGSTIMDGADNRNVYDYWIPYYDQYMDCVKNAATPYLTQRLRNSSCVAAGMLMLHENPAYAAAFLKDVAQLQGNEGTPTRVLALWIEKHQSIKTAQKYRTANIPVATYSEYARAMFAAFRHYCVHRTEQKPVLVKKLQLMTGKIFISGSAHYTGDKWTVWHPLTGFHSLDAENQLLTGFKHYIQELRDTLYLESLQSASIELPEESGETIKQWLEGSSEDAQQDAVAPAVSVTA